MANKKRLSQGTIIIAMEDSNSRRTKSKKVNKVRETVAQGLLVKAHSG